MKRQPRFKTGDWVTFDTEQNTKEEFDTLFNQYVKFDIKRPFQIKRGNIGKTNGLISIEDNPIECTGHHDGYWSSAWFTKIDGEFDIKVINVLYGKK